MNSRTQGMCKHWRVICERNGVAQWEEPVASRLAAIDRNGEPPGPTEDGDLFRIEAPTPGAWSPSRRRLPLVGEGAYDVAIKDALLSEDFGDFLWRGTKYRKLLEAMHGGHGSLKGLFWTIDQECDPCSITLQDLIDLQNEHTHHEEDCDDDECQTCGDVEFPDDADAFRDQECTACDLMEYRSLIMAKSEAFLRRFLSGRGLRYDRHRCAVDFVEIEPPEASGVYFVLGAGNCVKIGLGRNIKKRISELQTSHSVRLSLLAFEQTDAMRDLESAYHRRFAPLRTYGEWFRFTGELRELVLAKNIAHRAAGARAA